ncbi:MAG: hypothetical protein WC606_02140 [Candidatus Absconditabacterales bacterium]|jgi:hypothetical protein
MTTEKRHENMNMLVIVLLALNVLLGIYISFFKRDALWLETLKAGGAENMNMAQQLYNSPAYIQQQKATLDQILGSMNQAAAPTTTAQPEVQPTVTQ